MSKAKSLNRQGGGDQKATIAQNKAWPMNTAISVEEVKRALKNG